MYFQRSGLGVGVTPETQEHITMWNRTGSTLSRGAIVQIDEAKTQSESTSTSPGVDGTMYGNVIVPVTGDPLRVGTFMCYEGPSTCADNTKGLFTLVGVVDCDIEDGAVALVDVLTVQASLELDVNGTRAGQKAVAKALATRASGGVVVPCFFNGYGFASIALA